MPTVTITQSSPPDIYASFISGFDMMKRDGSIVTPSSTPVATILPGGGVVVEEATTNLWSGALNIYNNLGIPATLTRLEEQLFGEPVYRLTMTPNTQSQVDDLRVNFWNHGVYGSYRTYLANTAYCSSIFWRQVDKPVEVGGTPSNIGGWANNADITFPNGWKRHSSYRDGTVTTDKSDSKYFGFRCPSINLGESVSIDFACPMIEQGRIFATAYVNGSRGNGVLNYPSSILNTDEWTIAFTVDINFTSPNWRMFFMPWGYMYLGVPPNSTSLTFSYVESGTQKSVGNISCGLGTHVIVVSYVQATNNLKIWVDGVLKVNTTVILNPSYLPANFAIGHYNGSQYFGTGLIMRYFMLYNRAINDSEVAAFTFNKAFYRWLDSTFGWNSVNANKDWLNQYYSSYNLQVAEDNITISEVPKKNTTKLTKETFTITDKTKANITKIIKDALNIAEAYLDNISFILKIYETVTLLDLLKKTISILENENLAVTEKSIKNPTKKILETTISITDADKAVKDFTKKPIESISVVEVLAKNINLPKQDSFSIADKLVNNTTKKTIETISFLEKSIKNITKPQSESFAISETSARKPTMLKKETFSIAEAIKYNFTKINKENINFAELYTDIIGFILKFIETVNIVETPKKNTTIPQKESFNIVDAIKKQPTKKVLESITFSEIKKAIITFKLAEAIGIADAIKNNVSILKQETVSIIELIKKQPTKKVLENISFTEIWKSTNNFKRTLAETIAVSDKIIKNAIIGKYEAFSILDYYLRSANTVISDLFFVGEDLTLDVFKQAQTPVGYTEFKDFIAGEHYYQKALIRLLIEGSLTGGRPYIDQWELNIDVPDIFDSGTAEIPAANTRVNFNKSFNAPPEVQITLRGGTRGIPCITSVDETGFYIEIIDPVTGQYVAGSFSWTAKGY